MIDLFSDTVTKPTVGMRKAMAEAEVGDEQLGEDPTTKKLEEKFCSLTGQQSAIFLPSATMANEIAIRLWCRPGDELIAAQDCHLYVAETGGPAVHAQVMTKGIATQTGIFDSANLKSMIRVQTGPLYPKTALVSIENTTNFGGGVPWPLETLNSVVATAKEHELKTHLDGSRIFNAAKKLKVELKDLTHQFDSVTICLSKGLGCPMGAILAFSKEFYPEVRRMKQLFGGALRQSGIVAAAGLYALQNHVERLTEDHENAGQFAMGLSDLRNHLKVENDPPGTNMVFFHLLPAFAKRADEFHQKCIENGVRFSKVGANRFRAVFHLDVQKSKVSEALSAVKLTCHSLDK